MATFADFLKGLSQDKKTAFLQALLGCESFTASANPADAEADAIADAINKKIAEKRFFFRKESSIVGKVFRGGGAFSAVSREITSDIVSDLIMFQGFLKACRENCDSIKKSIQDTLVKIQDSETADASQVLYDALVAQIPTQSDIDNANALYNDPAVTAFNNSLYDTISPAGSKSAVPSLRELIEKQRAIEKLVETASKQVAAITTPPAKTVIELENRHATAAAAIQAVKDALKESACRPIDPTKGFAASALRQIAIVEQTLELNLSAGRLVLQKAVLDQLRTAEGAVTAIKQRIDTVSKSSAESQSALTTLQANGAAVARAREVVAETFVHLDVPVNVTAALTTLNADVTALDSIIAQQKAVEDAIVAAATKLPDIIAADTAELDTKKSDADTAITAITTEIRNPLILDGAFKTAAERKVVELKVDVANAAAQRKAQLIAQSVASSPSGEIDHALTQIDRALRDAKNNPVVIVSESDMPKALRDELKTARANIEVIQKSIKSAKFGANVAIKVDDSAANKAATTVNAAAIAQKYDTLHTRLTAAKEAVEKYITLQKMQKAFGAANKITILSNTTGSGSQGRLQALTAINIDTLKLGAPTNDFPPTIKLECALFEAKLKAQIAIVEALIKIDASLKEIDDWEKNPAKKGGLSVQFFHGMKAKLTTQQARLNATVLERLDVATLTALITSVQTETNAVTTPITTANEAQAQAVTDVTAEHSTVSAQLTTLKAQIDAIDTITSPELASLKTYLTDKVYSALQAKFEEIKTDDITTANKQAHLDAIQIIADGCTRLISTDIPALIANAKDIAALDKKIKEAEEAFASLIADYPSDSPLQKAAQARAEAVAYAEKFSADIEAIGLTNHAAIRTFLDAPAATADSCKAKVAALETALKNEQGIKTAVEAIEGVLTDTKIKEKVVDVPAAATPVVSEISEKIAELIKLGLKETEGLLAKFKTDHAALITDYKTLEARYQTALADQAVSPSTLQAIKSEFETLAGNINAKIVEIDTAIVAAKNANSIAGQEVLAKVGDAENEINASFPANYFTGVTPDFSGLPLLKTELEAQVAALRERLEAIRRTLMTPANQVDLTTKAEQIKAEVNALLATVNDRITKEKTITSALQEVTDARKSIADHLRVLTVFYTTAPSDKVGELITQLTRVRDTHLFGNMSDAEVRLALLKLDAEKCAALVTTVRNLGIPKFQEALREATEHKDSDAGVRQSLSESCKTAQSEIQAAREFISKNKELIAFEAAPTANVKVADHVRFLDAANEKLVTLLAELSNRAAIQPGRFPAIQDEIKATEKDVLEKSDVLYATMTSDALAFIITKREVLEQLLGDLANKLRLPNYLDTLPESDKIASQALYDDIERALSQLSDEELDKKDVKALLSLKKAVDEKSKEFSKSADRYLQDNALTKEYNEKIKVEIAACQKVLEDCNEALDPSRVGFDGLTEEFGKRGYADQITVLRGTDFSAMTLKALSEHLKKIEALHASLQKDHQNIIKISNTTAQPAPWPTHLSSEKNINEYLDTLAKKPRAYRPVTRKDGKVVDATVVVLLPLDKAERKKIANDFRLAGEYLVWGTPGTAEDQYSRALQLTKYYALVGMGKKICYPAGESSCQSNDFKRFVKFCDWVDSVNGPIEALKKLDMPDSGCPTISAAELAEFKRTATLMQAKELEATNERNGILMPYEEQSVEKRERTLAQAIATAKTEMGEAVRAALKFDSGKVVDSFTSVVGNVSRTRLIIDLEKNGASANDPKTKETADITIVQTIKTLQGTDGKPMKYVEVTCESKGVRLSWETECELKAMQTLATRRAAGSDPTVMVTITPPEVNPHREMEVELAPGGNKIKLTEKEAQLIKAYRKAGYEEIGLVVNGGLQRFEGTAPKSAAATKPGALQEQNLGGNSVVGGANRFPPTAKHDAASELSRQTGRHPIEQHHASSSSTPPSRRT